MWFKDLNEIISLMRRMGENMSTEENNSSLFFENFNLPIIIEEGLIKSYDIDSVISFISKSFNLRNTNNEKISLSTLKNYRNNKNKIYKKIKENDCEVIVIEVDRDFTEENKLNYYLKKYGWILSRIDNEIDLIKYTYEKKFDIEIFNFQLKRELEDLYHVTDEKKLKSIMKKGLQPKAKDIPTGYMNDERIYLFAYLPSKYEFQMANISGKPVILKIKLNELNDNFKFHFDSRVNNALYTFEPIFPNALEIISP